MRKFLNLMEKLWQKKKIFLKNAKLYIWDGTSSSKMSTSWPRIIPALVVIQGTLKLEICIKSKYSISISYGMGGAKILNLDPPWHIKMVIDSKGTVRAQDQSISAPANAASIESN